VSPAVDVTSLVHAEELRIAMDKLKRYTMNRNSPVAIAEANRERVEYSDWYVARSLDGSVSLEYAPTIAELRQKLAARNLGLAEVVVEHISGGDDSDSPRTCDS